MEWSYRILMGFMLSVMACAGTLYETDFEEFTAGDNRWAGTGGWVSNDVTSGAQGIILNPVEDLPLGKAGYIGYSRPTSRFTSVYRNVNHDPVASGLPIVHFESLLGVQDSTNGFRDRFRITFYNTGGGFLAGLIFDNNTGLIRRDDGVSVTSTGVKFLLGDPILGVAALQVLELRIDLTANTWSGVIDGIPLFTNVAFTATARARTLGPVAAEWDVAALSTLGAGNNWLLVADWLVGALPREPFTLSSISRSAGTTNLKWQGQSGFTYQVEHSSDLTIWRQDLPNSTFNPSANGQLSFIDNAAQPLRRFYRVRRDFAR